MCETYRIPKILYAAAFLYMQNQLYLCLVKIKSSQQNSEATHQNRKLEAETSEGASAKGARAVGLFFFILMSC